MKATPKRQRPFYLLSFFSLVLSISLWLGAHVLVRSAINAHLYQRTIKSTTLKILLRRLPNLAEDPLLVAFLSLEKHWRCAHNSVPCRLVPIAQSHLDHFPFLYRGDFQTELRFSIGTIWPRLWEGRIGMCHTNVET